MTPLWDAKSQLSKYKDKDLFDCMIAEYLLMYGRSIGTLDTTLKKYKTSTLDELATKQKQELNKYPLLNKLFEQIEIPLIKVLWNMEQQGILLDVPTLQKIGKEIDLKLKDIETDLHLEMGNDININSSVQIGNYLAEIAKVPLKRTKTGRFATGESEISQHSDNFPIIKTLLKYRELSKLRSTYIDSLISKVDENSKIHTTYHQVAANTGRLASTSPNLQNIPVTSLYGQKIKSCFKSDPGNILVSFDYSQQELRILAHLTSEDTLIQAFKENKDIHKLTACSIFNTKYSDVTKEQRSVGKTINFGIIYGMSSYGLSISLKITVDEAQKFIDTFYTTYPKIKKFYDIFFEQGKLNGYVETLLGRRRYVFDYPGQKFIDNNTRRVLLNYPIQGSAADLIKIAMIKIQNEILNTDQEIHLLLQIHDDLVFQLKNDPTKLKEFIFKTKEIMCNVYPLKVPMEVDVKIGEKWGELTPISIT